MQAIRTQYRGPSQMKGSRIHADCEGGSVTIGYDDGLSPEENHKAAMEALCKRLKWAPMQVSGVYKHDHYWVSVPKSDPF